MQKSNMSGQQAQTMPEPPAIMTGKDLNYMNDMLAWNLNAMKKAHFFARHCQDADIKQAIEDAGHMHQHHYEQLLTHLHGHTQDGQYHQ
nr:hypothetical protein [Shouchella lonarensis]